MEQLYSLAPGTALRTPAPAVALRAADRHVPSDLRGLQPVAAARQAHETAWRRSSACTSCPRRAACLGWRLLEELEAAARQLGYARIRLDTGPRQAHAQAMYELAGYHPIDAYNSQLAGLLLGEISCGDGFRARRSWARRSAVGLELLEAMAIVLAVGSARRAARRRHRRGRARCCCSPWWSSRSARCCSGGCRSSRCRSWSASRCCCSGSSGCARACSGWPGGARRRTRSRSTSRSARRSRRMAPPPPGRPDWPARVVAFKGVLLEGVEVVLIVAALAAGPGRSGAGAGGRRGRGDRRAGDRRRSLHRPLTRLPESHLKYAVGLVLSSFGVFFLGEGLDVVWPGGDPALLYVAATLVLVSQAQVAALAPSRWRRDARAPQARVRRDGGAAGRVSLALVVGLALQAARVVGGGRRLHPARARDRGAGGVAAPAHRRRSRRSSPRPGPRGSSAAWRRGRATARSGPRWRCIGGCASASRGVTPACTSSHSLS